MRRLDVFRPVVPSGYPDAAPTFVGLLQGRGYQPYPPRVTDGTISSYRTKFDLTRSQYYDLLSRFDKRCGICGRQRKLVVDHDHQTNKIRGLLCSNCNSLLGMAEDNTLILENAIVYLKSN